jgi:hypothetical protein
MPDGRRHSRRSSSIKSYSIINGEADCGRLEAVDMHARIARELTDRHRRQHQYRDVGISVRRGMRRTHREGPRALQGARIEPTDIG